MFRNYEKILIYFMRVTSKLFNKILYIKCLKNINYKQYNLKDSSWITKLARWEKNYSDYVNINLV